MKLFVLIFLILSGSNLTAQNSLNIIPAPTTVKMGKGIFMLTKNTCIVIEGSGLEKVGAFLNEYLQQECGYKLKITKDYTGINIIRLNNERLDNKITGAYILMANNKSISIAGNNESGVFYGIQTLMQLIEQSAAKKKLSTSNVQRCFRF